MSTQTLPPFATQLAPKTDKERAAAERYSELARAREELIHRDKPAPRPPSQEGRDAMHRALCNFHYSRHAQLGPFVHYEESAGLQ